LPPKVPVLAGVHQLVEAALRHLGGVLEVVEEVLLRAVEHLDLDVLAEVHLVDEELQRAPGALQPLEIRVVDDGVDLRGQPRVDLRDHRVDDVLVDALGGAAGGEHLRDEVLHAAADDVVALLARLDLALVEDLVEERSLLQRLRPALGLGLQVTHGCCSSLMGFLGVPGARSGAALVAETELLHELGAALLVTQQPLDLLAERRHVAQRTLEGVERRPQLEQLAHLGHLVGDAFGG
jgi:hypothetical protein